MLWSANLGVHLEELCSTTMEKLLQKGALSGRKVYAAEYTSRSVNYKTTATPDVSTLHSFEVNS